MLYNTSSVQHVVSLYVLNRVHTEPEHWWLFSCSIVNGTGIVEKRERCPAAGSGPDRVHKEILGVSFKYSSEACIIFDPGSTRSEYILVTPKSKVCHFSKHGMGR